jgi:quinol monooxygenase YgiN
VASQRRIIDLSLPLENYATEPYPPTITYFDHRAGARRLGEQAKVDPSDFPEGMALASEAVKTGTHSGTHVDAPWHYGPLCEGRPSLTIDNVPLEWLYGHGVVASRGRRLLPDGGTMTHVIIAKWTAQKGKEDQIQQIIRKMTTLSLNEEGCLMYQGHRSLEDDRIFVIYEQYTDGAASEAHSTSDHFKRYVLGDAQQLLDGRVRSVYETI